jgi:hypothetical protein
MFKYCIILKYDVKIILDSLLVNVIWKKIDKTQTGQSFFIFDLKNTFVNPVDLFKKYLHQTENLHSFVFDCKEIKLKLNLSCN